MHDRITRRTLFNPFGHSRFRATSCTVRGALFHIVACILMHERITHKTLFNPFGHSRFRATSCTLRGALFHIVACILMHEWFHLGAEWSAVVFGRVFSCNKLHVTGSIISYRSVHLDARPNHARNIIQPFRVFTISCNKLHATEFTGVHYFVDYSELRWVMLSLLII